jgi:putative hydrolase of the HAD superfamily
MPVKLSTANHSQNVLILDYDNTLCPAENHALKAMDILITQFIEQHLSLPQKEANILRKEYCMSYGTTLQGLMENYSLHPNDYFDFIHKIPKEALPKPDSNLERWLRTIEQQNTPTFLFTNGRLDWVTMGLESMKLTEVCSFLKAFIDLEWLNWEGKPHPSAYETVEKHVKEVIGSHATLFFADDSLDNLYGAHLKGWKTIWIHPECEHVRKPSFKWPQRASYPNSFEPDFAYKRLADVPILRLINGEASR